MLSEDWGYGVEAAVDVALLGRYYERIADHAASMGRRIIYVVTGQFPGRPTLAAAVVGCGIVPDRGLVPDRGRFAAQALIETGSQLLRWVVAQHGRQKRSGSNDVARPLRLETTPHADHSLLDQSASRTRCSISSGSSVVIVLGHHDDSPSHPVEGLAALEIMQPLLAVLGMVPSVVLDDSLSDG